jgi:hypothetical protein
MEEILASIRKIIADEKEEPIAPPEAAEVPKNNDDVLELTQMVQDDGSVVDLAATAPTPPPMPVMEPAMPPPEDKPIMPEPEKAQPEDGLVSDQAADAASSSMAALVNTVQIERMASVPPLTPVGNGARTLEDMVMDSMRPMLKEWLDQNLPGVVDRLVQKEIDRIAHKAQE